MQGHFNVSIKSVVRGIDIPTCHKKLYNYYGIFRFLCDKDFALCVELVGMFHEGKYFKDTS